MRLPAAPPRGSRNRGNGLCACAGPRRSTVLPRAGARAPDHRGSVPACGHLLVYRLRRICGLAGQQPVLAGEVALHQGCGLRAGGDARIEAAEERLDEAARDQRRELAARWGVEGREVERTRVAQGGVGGSLAQTARGRGRSRAERLRGSPRSCVRRPPAPQSGDEGACRPPPGTSSVSPTESTLGVPWSVPSSSRAGSSRDSRSSRRLAPRSLPSARVRGSGRDGRAWKARRRAPGRGR